MFLSQPAGAGAKTRLESRIKKFTPHCIFRLNGADSHGFTAVHWAVQKGQCPLVTTRVVTMPAVHWGVHKSQYLLVTAPAVTMPAVHWAAQKGRPP